MPRGYQALLTARVPQWSRATLVISGPTSGCPQFWGLPLIMPRDNYALLGKKPKEKPTMTPSPSFETHKIVDGRWVLKTPSAPTPTPTTDAKGVLCPPELSRKRLLREIEIAAGQALVRGYPTTRVAAARKGRLGNKEDNRNDLWELLQWYKGVLTPSATTLSSTTTRPLPEA